MLSRLSGALLVVAFASGCTHSGVVTETRDATNPQALGPEAAPSEAHQALEVPDPPPDGTGVVSVSRHARGFDDGQPGRWYVTLLFDFIDRTLVGVDDRVRFVPDPKPETRGD